MHWVNVTATSERSGLEALETWFWDHGAVSVTVEDGEDKPIYEPPPGEQPVWEEVLVTGLFEEDAVIENLESALLEAGFKLSCIARLEDRAWEREWLHRFKPMQFGEGLWVCPSGFQVPAVARTVIRLDPGLAFGTGTHETTRLCLEYLDGLDVSGCSVIDYGCGSGVLGIGAALKGASTITAIDTDPQALTATRENARRNNVELRADLPG
ncbi:MAG: 50S ribosomal protein L11 methyltransferase, partial [Gammaproteobacteria bacterium]|nr:50S ribosomal protein L11 methyltransferase [Gammaproteobacteria bacterium]